MEIMSNQHNSLHKLKFTLRRQVAYWESCNINETWSINQNISLCKHDSSCRVNLSKHQFTQRCATPSTTEILFQIQN